MSQPPSSNPDATNSANRSQRLHLAQLRQWTRERLTSLRMSGVDVIQRASGAYSFAEIEEWGEAESSPATTSSSPPQSARTTPAISTDRSPAPSKQPKRQTPLVETINEPYPPKPNESERDGIWRTLQSEVAECQACTDLARRRNNVVFGYGNLKPRLVFLGEAPGEDEDKQGIPFVGRAGQLLTKIIEAMKLSRDDVYILNTIKCRPPGNRNPAEAETANCWPFLMRQLDFLQPEIICCLGSVAARTLLQTNRSIARLRGEFFPFKQSKVLVTYHPSYLLRTEGQSFGGKSPKRMVWDDMKLILAELGLPVP